MSDQKALSDIIWTPDGEAESRAMAYRPGHDPEVRSISWNNLLLSDEMFAGKWQTASEVRINPDTCIQSTVLLACARIISETIASLPLNVYRRTKDGHRELAIESPLNKVLSFAPNEWQTKFEWVEQLVFTTCIWGNNYTLVKSGQYGSVSLLHHLHPSRMTVERLENGRLKYTYNDPQMGRQIPYTQDQIMHVRWTPEPDGVKGMMPIEIARDAIALARATEIYASKFWANMGRPGFVLQTDQALSSETAERLRDNWERIHRGVHNAWKTAVLTNGLKAEPVGGSNQDSQFLEVRKFQCEEICRVFRLPLALVQGQQTGGDLETQGQEFISYTLMPWLRRIELAISRSLIYDDDVYFAEFDTSSLLRGNSGQRASYYSTMLNLGLMTINEARRNEGLPSIGPDGDHHLVAMNLQPLEEAVKPKPEQPPPGAPPAAGPGDGGPPPKEPDGPPSLSQVKTGVAPMKAVMGKPSPPKPQVVAQNRSFCPTGEGGGIDNSCGSNEHGDVRIEENVKGGGALSQTGHPFAAGHLITVHGDGKVKAVMHANIDRDAGVVQVVESHVPKEFQGKGVYTSLLKTLSQKYRVVSDEQTSKAAAKAYEKLGASYSLKTGRYELDNRPKLGVDGKSHSRSFCPTGEGGGIDNSCGASSGGAIGRGDGDPRINIGKLLDKIADNPDGFTIDRLTAEQPSDGVMVSEFPNDSKRAIQLDAGNIKSAETRDKLVSWLVNNRDVMDGRTDRYIGGWSSGGKFYLDVATRFPPGKEKEALDAGRNASQLAVFNLGTFKETWVKFDKDDPRKPEGWDKGFASARKKATENQVYGADSPDLQDEDHAAELTRHGHHSVRSIVVDRLVSRGYTYAEASRLVEAAELQRIVEDIEHGYRASGHSRQGVDDRSVPSVPRLGGKARGGSRREARPVVVQGRAGRPAGTLQQRAYCATGDGGGVDNSCSSNQPGDASASGGGLKRGVDVMLGGIPHVADIDRKSLELAAADYASHPKPAGYSPGAATDLWERSDFVARDNPRSPNVVTSHGEMFPSTAVGANGLSIKIEVVGQYLSNRHVEDRRAIAGGVGPTAIIDTSKPLTRDQHEYIVGALSADVLHAYERGLSPGFYSDDLEKTMSTMALIHPELESDENSRFMFTALTAITSNGLGPDKNLSIANDLYEMYKAHGTIVPNEAVGSGDRATAVKKSLQLLQSMTDSFGVERTRRLLSGYAPVGRVNAVLRKLSEKSQNADWREAAGAAAPWLMDDFAKGSGKKKEMVTTSSEKATSVVPVAAIFGPKIGAFFANLSGRHDFVTMDRWLMRSVGRTTGELVTRNSPGSSSNQAKTCLKALAASSSKSMLFGTGLTRAQVVRSLKIQQKTGVIEEGGAAYKWALAGSDSWKKVPRKPATETEKASGQFGKTGNKVIDDVHRAANTLMKSLVNEQQDPRSPTARATIRDIISDVVKNVEKKYPERAGKVHRDEVQAILWQYEKNLFKHLGADTEIEENSLFSVAADRVLASVREGKTVKLTPAGRPHSRSEQPLSEFRDSHSDIGHFDVEQSSWDDDIEQSEIDFNELFLELEKELVEEEPPKGSRRVDSRSESVSADDARLKKKRLFTPIKHSNSSMVEYPCDRSLEEAMGESASLIGAHRDLENGTPVAFRIDIPTFEKTKASGKPVFAVAVHEDNGDGQVGKRIGFDGIARMAGPVRFLSQEDDAMNIATGDAGKSPIATVKGGFDRNREVPEDIDDWAAVGYDPQKASYFYDKRTGREVSDGTDAVSVGNTVFTRDPKYGDRDVRVDYRSFCPTGEGGGIKNDCSPKDKDKNKAAVAAAREVVGPVAADDSRLVAKVPFTPIPESSRNSGFTPIATDDHMKSALSGNVKRDGEEVPKSDLVGSPRELPEGKKVALRLDIPAYTNHDAWVVTVHEPSKSAGGVGKVIGYDSLTRLAGDVTFHSHEGVATAIAMGKNKDTIATVHGKISSDRTVPEDIDSWTPVGYNPHKAAFFYNKRTGQEVVGGTDAISIGNSVFVREPKHGDRNAKHDYRSGSFWGVEHRGFCPTGEGGGIDNSCGVKDVSTMADIGDGKKQWSGDSLKNDEPFRGASRFDSVSVSAGGHVAKSLDEMGIDPGDAVDMATGSDTGGKLFVRPAPEFSSDGNNPVFFSCEREFAGVSAGITSSSVIVDVGPTGSPEPVLKHGTIDVSPDIARDPLKRQSAGREFMRVMVDSVSKARELGVTKVVLNAAGQAGSNSAGWRGYTIWPRMGFDAPLPFHVRQKLPDTLSHCRTLLDLHATPEGTRWWRDVGGTDIDVQLDLRDRSSPQNKVFDRFIQHFSKDSRAMTLGGGMDWLAPGDVTKIESMWEEIWDSDVLDDYSSEDQDFKALKHGDT